MNNSTERACDWQVAGSIAAVTVIYKPAFKLC